MKDLLEIVNPNEVEVAAKIIDPKNRVPDLPFGHLNRGWKRLKWKMRSGDVMWSFRTPGYQPSNSEGYKGPQYSAPHNVVFGYAIVRRKKIVAEFLTQWD
jgi:hypothetical protein